MALALRIGQMVGTVSGENEDDAKLAKRLLGKVEKGMTEREKLELVMVLARINGYAEDYEENVPEKDIIDFVMMIKTI